MTLNDKAKGIQLFQEQRGTNAEASEDALVIIKTYFDTKKFTIG